MRMICKMNLPCTEISVLALKKGKLSTRRIQLNSRYLDLHCSPTEKNFPVVLQTTFRAEMVVSHMITVDASNLKKQNFLKLL